MKKLLILGANIFQIPVIETAKKMGLFVGIVDINSDAPAMKFADEFFTCSIKDKEGVLEIAKKFCPNAIFCGACDTGVVTAAYVSQSLGLPGLTEEVALNATDKYRMICAFESHCVPHPTFQMIRSGEEIKLDEDMNYPLIVKQIDGAGSRGLNFIENESELIEKVGLCSSMGSSGDVLLEEYMQGPEVSVELVVMDGIPHILQITDKLTSGAPNFIEIAHSQPSALPENTKKRIMSVASDAVLAVGLFNSAAHVEIKITKQGPKMVELGARLGGGFITSHLINTSVSGINMMQIAILMALGEKPDVEHYSDSGTCVAVRSIPSKAGIISAISGVDASNKIDGIQRIIMVAKIGNRCEAAKSNSERIGYVFATSDTTEKALVICQKAIDMIDIQYV